MAKTTTRKRYLTNRLAYYPKFAKFMAQLRREVRGDPSYINNTQSNLRKQVLLKLGNQCAKCGFSDHRALQVDHIDGGGAKHVKSLSWSKRYREILNNPSGLQLLCANCNWIKRHDNKEAVGRPKKG